jgi:hypothetical protein
MRQLSAAALIGRHVRKDCSLTLLDAKSGQVLAPLRLTYHAASRTDTKSARGPIAAAMLIPFKVIMDDNAREWVGKSAAGCSNKPGS